MHEDEFRATCPDCGNTFFNAVVDSPEYLTYTVRLIQCSELECGKVVGALQDVNLDLRLSEILKEIKSLRNDIRELKA